MKTQCQHRWRYVLEPSIARASRPSSQRVEDAVIKLKSAIQTHGDKDWVAAVSALVPGLTGSQYITDGALSWSPTSA
jgi:hypothetical protein